MSANDIALAKRRANDLARINRYLAKGDNRLIYNERRRQLYALKKGIPFYPRNVGDADARAGNDDNNNMFDDHQPEQERIEEDERPAPKRRRLNRADAAVAEVAAPRDGKWDLDAIIAGLVEIGADKSYISNTKVIAKHVDLSDFRKLLKTENAAKKVVATFRALKMNAHSEKGVAQTVLWVADKLTKLPMSAKVRAVYADWFDLTKLDSAERSAKKSMEVLEATWPEYLGRVEEKYGINRARREWIIPHMYGDSPDNGGLRDDLKNILLATKMPSADSLENVLIVPRAGNVKLHVGSHKTANKIGARKAEYTPIISTAIRNYIAANNIQVDKAVFGKGALSKFVGDLSESLGFKTRGIGFYRRMWAAPKGSSHEEIIAAARRLGHSTRAHMQSYQRERKA